MLGDLERRPAFSHQLAQGSTDIRRGKKHAAARLNVREELVHGADRIVDMFDDLNGQGAVELRITRQLRDASQENISARFARVVRRLRRKFRSNSPPKQGPCFIEQISVAATNFEQIASGHSTVSEIPQQTFEGSPQSLFLIEITGVGITGSSPLEVGRILIDKLHGFL